MPTLASMCVFTSMLYKSFEDYKFKLISANISCTAGIICGVLNSPYLCEVDAGGQLTKGLARIEWEDEKKQNITVRNIIWRETYIYSEKNNNNNLGNRIRNFC